MDYGGRRVDTHVLVDDKMGMARHFLALVICDKLGSGAAAH